MASVPERELFRQCFRCITSDAELCIALAEPYEEENPELGPLWYCNYSVSGNGIGNEYSGRAAGADWLQALLMALLAASKRLEGDELTWVTSQGVPAWAVLPKLVPIEWGYQFYRKICDHISDEETLLKASLDKRRPQANS